MGLAAVGLTKITTVAAARMMVFIVAPQRALPARLGWPTPAWERSGMTGVGSSSHARPKTGKPALKAGHRRIASRPGPSSRPLPGRVAYHPPVQLGRGPRVLASQRGVGLWFQLCAV